MNLYESISQVSNCIKEKGEVKELLEKYKKVRELRNDVKYIYFFSLIDGKEFYGFFAPNISMQIINNVYKNSDFEIISKEICELIINNEDIKEYVQVSTKVCEIITQEIVSLFNPQNFKGNAKTVYAYNKLSEKLGYIGFIDNLKVLNGKGKELDIYFKERNKIVDEGAKVFPISKFNNEFLNEIYNLNVSKEVVDSIEKLNLILYIIERIIYCDIYDKLIYIKSENISIIDKKEKSNIINQEMQVNNEELLFKHFPILILENNYYFLYSEQIKYSKEETTIKCKCFSCKFEEKNALVKLSITDTVELFKDE